VPGPRLWTIPCSGMGAARANLSRGVFCELPRWNPLPHPPGAFAGERRSAPLTPSWGPIAWWPTEAGRGVHQVFMFPRCCVERATTFRAHYDGDRKMPASPSTGSDQPPPESL
jgi:hypothetical protein